MSRSKLAKTAITPGEPAAIYCRISHTKDEDQTGVDRQERICREIAERLQLRVEATHVYVDNNRSAWQRNRKRPGWEEMLGAMGKARSGTSSSTTPTASCGSPRTSKSFRR